MSAPTHSWATPLAEFALALLAQNETAARARIIAEHVASIVPDSAVAVYIGGTGQPVNWIPKAAVGDIKIDPSLLSWDSGLLGACARSKQIEVFPVTQLAREDYLHLDVRRTITSIGYVPVLLGEDVFGLIEVITFTFTLREADLDVVSEFANVAATALSSAAAWERERNTQLDSINRLTQLYDLEKVFYSTLELDNLLPIIATKLREIMSAQAVNLWMVETKETLVLFQQAGVDPTTSIGVVQRAGEGTAFAISESGEPLLIASPSDERLTTRNAGIRNGGVKSLLSAPLMDGEQCVGVVEIINGLDGRPFDEDDLFMLLTVCETANGALHNAGLLQAERKAEILETLVNISGEITSTLNLDRVAQTIVNGPQSVIPFERSALALEINSRLQLKTVSGVKAVNHGDPDMGNLRELLEWVSFSGEPLLIAQEENGAISSDREETRAKFQRYFADSGMRVFYGYPLIDDQGRVGILSYESSDARALQPVHFELIKILAGQATVALRNAQLYQEVPFINVLEPILQRKRKFMALEKRRRAITLIAAAAAVLFLIFVPLPLRVAGNAVVTPQHRALIQPEMDGVVKRVLVHEGQAVRRGTVLAEMDDWNFRRDVASAQSKYDLAVSAMGGALAANNTSEAGVQQAQVAFWNSELERTRERLEQTRLRSPIDGVVGTPQVENFAGRKLDAGDTLAEIIDSSRATIDVAVDEQDLRLLHPGQPAAVKLESFPTRTLHGLVSIVSPQGQAAGEGRIFFARIDVANPEALVRPGMQGRGKVSTGWHPAGYVIFRGAGIWVWSKLWSWFGF
jgi:RND family efflux transporter MFP subunit